MGNLEHEQELIDGFLSRRPAAETACVVELQKYLRAEIRTYYPKLWQELSNLEQSALLKLCEMREKPAEAAKIRPPLAALARFSLVGAASREKRVKHWRPLEEEDEPPVVSNQEEAVELREMLDIAESLPRGMVRTMLAQEAYVAGDGPALDEALGVSSDNARRRLARAQMAAINIAAGDQVEMPEEDQDE